MKKQHQLALVPTDPREEIAQRMIQRANGEPRRIQRAAADCEKWAVDSRKQNEVADAEQLEWIAQRLYREAALI